jgi:hypothetical protein
VNLLWRIETYLRRTRTPPTRFGRQALGDARLVMDMRNGREPRPATARRIVAFLESQERGAGQ